MDPKIEKWRRWIRAIETDVIGLNHYRRCNRVFEAIVEANPQLLPGNAYLDYFRNIYATYAAMAVRRQARPHQDAISLAGLLRDLADNPTVPSRSWIKEFYAEAVGETGITYPADIAAFLADSTYAAFADASGEYLNVARLESELTSLDAATDDIVELVDRQIAHHDKRRSSGRATFAKLDGAIEVVTSITSDYTRLITGKANLSMVPVDLTNALDVFNIPWIDRERPPNLAPDDV